MKAIFIGACAAAVLGLFIGLVAKPPLDVTPQGQQQLIPSPERSASAFDYWQPSEGAPPPPLQDDPLYASAGADYATAPYEPAYYAPPLPAAPAAYRAAPPEPQPYLPSARGDILAPAAYEAGGQPWTSDRGLRGSAPPVAEYPPFEQADTEDMAAAGDTSSSSVDMAALDQ